MKKPILLSGLLGVMLAFTGCSKEEEVVPSSDAASDVSIPVTTTATNAYCQPLVVDLMAGKHTDAGDIIVSNDATNLYVTYITSGGWVLKETHLYVGSREGLPSTSKGNPQIGNFPYKGNHINSLTNYTYTIPLSSLGNEPCLTIAAHAVVALPGTNGECERKETGWGAGDRLSPKGSWAMYSTYCLCDNAGGGVGGN